MSSAHGNLVNACVALINARGGFAWKCQSGVFNLGSRYVHAGKPGVPDVVGVWPSPEAYCGKNTCSTHSVNTGRMIAVECKTGTGRLSKIQRSVHDELAKRGALVLVVRSITDLETALNRRNP